MSARALACHPIVWSLVVLFCIMTSLLMSYFPALTTFPSQWTLPIAGVINLGIDPLFGALQPAGRVVSTMIDVPLRVARLTLQWLPWPVVAGLVVLAALRGAGWGVALFAVLAQGAVVLAGYWPQAMNTLAIVLMSLPPGVLIGFALGTMAFCWPRLAGPLTVLLDLMQTFPAFGFLIPLLILFGFGPAPGLIAGVLFAVPPMVRNTMLGLSMVPAPMIEAGRMCGATPAQLFWRVRIPAAKGQLLVGVNQTTMASLSMVIIVAIIGGFNDIGWEIVSAMRGADLGRSLLAGLVIVIMAILMDRITQGFAGQNAGRIVLSSRAFLVLGLLLILAGIGFRQLWPQVTLLPEAMGRQLAPAIDRQVLDFVALTAPFFGTLRNILNYGLILPLRIGVFASASPLVWGFALAPWMVAAYALVVTGLAGLFWRYSWRAGIGIILCGLVMATGLTRFPWPAFVLIMILLTFGAGGWRLSGMAGLLLAQILLTGQWVPFAQSLYLTIVAVLLCMLIGGTLGVLASESRRLSAFLRPINDALQTMPQFVFLIPALMLFKVGEFTALIAIMLYAVVPPIRYVEQGLRSVAPHLIEAAVQMGATRWQILWQVRLPQAWPVIRLGINQTIMAALSMLVIAALVGTRDLGQQVYVALSQADAGAGLIAGLSISLIALIADRLLRGQGVSRQPVRD